MFDPDNKLPSNFYSAPGESEFTHTGFTQVNLPPPPPDIDNDGVMDFEPVPLTSDIMNDALQGLGNMDTANQGPGTTTIVMAPKPPKPKNFKALSKAKIVETLSVNGSPRRVNTVLSMIDEDTGSGKAVVTVGRDIKQRKFEVPISIKDGTVTLGKARDIASNERVDLTSEQIFAAPDEDILRKELDDIYEKYNSFFKGKPNEKKIEALLKRYPSLTEAEARDYLEVQYESNKGIIGRTIDKAAEHKKKIILVSAVGAFFGVLYVRNRLKNRMTAQ